MNKLNAIAILGSALLLAACGGSSDDDDDAGGGGGGGSGTRTGVFVDAPVQGLDFRTVTQDDVTDAAGQFRFRSGETVAFGIGRLALGDAPGAPVLSPFDLAGSDDINDNVVTNIAVLLQSLDVDAGPDIRVPDLAASVAPASLDFAQDPQDFAADPAVLEFIRAATGDAARNPVAVAPARIHLLQALGLDDDGDGVPDAGDDCPNTPAGTPVNAQGCPLGGGGDPNLPPAADAGDDQEVIEGDAVALAGAGSDSDGTITGFAWEQTAGPAVELSDASTAAPSFTAPAVDDETNLVFRLTVTDDDGATDTDLAGVVVGKAPAPAFSGLMGACLDFGGPQAFCEIFGTAEQNLPDALPLAADAAPRGHLAPEPAANVAPTPKVVDDTGSIADWTGTASLFAGNSRLDRGEHIYTDYLFDAYGADDGADAQRLQLLDPLAEAATRTARFDALFQAAGDQFGAPAPVGALDHYGDATGPDAQADLAELRWAADAQNVFLLARFSVLTDADTVGMVVLLDTRAGPAAEIGFGTGLTTQRFDTAVLLTSAGVTVRDLATGDEAALMGAAVKVVPGADAAGARWQNSMEAQLPASLFNSAGGTRIGVIAGPRTDDGITPANVAYRYDEPVTIYNDKHQALALLAGSVDEFGDTISVRNLARGASGSFAIGPGYYERHFISGENISRENGRPEDNSRLQRYGFYAPTSPALNPGGEAPLTIWMHYRGGKAHSGAAWTPRLIKQLGEEQGNYIATPHARGTSTWYVTEAHQDFFEVFADVAGTDVAGNENLATPQSIAPLVKVNPDRVYLAGYSMGGYSSWLFGLLYPDLFAGAYPTSGAVTQGAWTGVGPDEDFCASGTEEIPEVGNASLCFVEANDSKANAQLNFRILENARHVPYVIHHGSNDELALTPGAERMGLRLLELGYRYDMTTFLGYEHYTQAIVDEWKDGAVYLNHFTRPRNPRQVTYKVSPALVHAVNTVTAPTGVTFDFNPDGAYWVDGLVVRDPDVDDPTQYGLIDAESEALAAPMILPTPRTVDGTSTPVFSPGGHSTPYVRHSLDWTEAGTLPTANAFNAQLTRLSAASLDLARMGLDLTQQADGLIESDGPLTLRLTQATVPLRVYLNGIERADAQVGTVITLALAQADFEGGAALIQLQPGDGGFAFAAPETSNIVAACRALAPEMQPFCDGLENFEITLIANCATFGGPPEFCATLGGHLHGVIEACRANGGSTFCKLADAFLEGFASGCRGIPEAPREFCALLGHERIADEELLAFEKSWTHRALGLQYELGASLPFVDALFVSTHNSFNSTNANDPQTLSGSDANQRYSTVDQLRMGVRAVEIDVHWMPSAEGFRPTVCHGNAFHFGCSYEKSLADELAEVRGWLDEHPDQVVLIYLENNLNEPLDGPTGELFGSEPYTAAAEAIRGTLGDLVYTPANHGSSCSAGHPLDASIASLRLQGKQLYIQTEGCDAGWADLVFSQSGATHDQGANDNGLETFSVDGMCGGFSRERHETRWTRYFEDGTLLGAATSMSDGSLTPPAAYAGMVRCGVNMPSMDHVTPSDPRLPAFVWSWQPGQPAISTTLNCALHAADGQFRAALCAQAQRHACARRTNVDQDAYVEREWILSQTAGPWASGAGACPSGYAFDVPRNGFDNELLKIAKRDADVNEVWLNYNDNGGDGNWVAAP